MKISVVMPSYLPDYPGASKNRDEKLHRAVESVIKQTYKDWELIVVADGCIRTYHEMKKYSDPRIKTALINKQKGFGIQRNTGISLAKGEVISYLDSDDMLAPNHLDFINENMQDYDWIYFNHWELRNNMVVNAKVDINKPYDYGTCNIAHRDRVFWTSEKYGNDDMIFVNRLKENKNNKFAGDSGYICCHISSLTGKGYES